VSRRAIVRIAIAVLAVSAMIGGPIAAANASDLTIKLALLHAAPGLRHSQARIARALGGYKNTRRAAPVIRAIRAQDRELTALRTKVRRAAPSTSTGASARRELIEGLGLILRSNYVVDTALRRQGPVGLTPGQTRRAVRLARRGDRLYRRGVMLLA
jgi:hypothetical protein